MALTKRTAGKFEGWVHQATVEDGDTFILRVPPGFVPSVALWPDASATANLYVTISEDADFDEGTNPSTDDANWQLWDNGAVTQASTDKQAVLLGKPTGIKVTSASGDTVFEVSS